MRIFQSKHAEEPIAGWSWSVSKLSKDQKDKYHQFFAYMQTLDLKIIIL
jgi:hypothetical protein